MRSSWYHAILAVCLVDLSTELNLRQVEKEIIDDILGSKAYDSRIRPQGERSKAKLQEIFCHRDSSTWSWSRCELAKSHDEVGQFPILHSFFISYLKILDLATIIFVNIFVRGFSDIDDVKMVRS